ncbi:hypothetical protein Tco_1134968 [Tanacetum coccineum]
MMAIGTCWRLGNCGSVNVCPKWRKRKLEIAGFKKSRRQLLFRFDEREKCFSRVLFVAEDGLSLGARLKNLDDSLQWEVPRTRAKDPDDLQRTTSALWKFSREIKGFGLGCCSIHTMLRRTPSLFECRSINAHFHINVVEFE